MSLPINRRTAIAALAGAASLAGSGAALAQAGSDFVRLVMPFPGGNPTDSSARKLAEIMQRNSGRTWIVENKPGAAGIIGTVDVARAKPDGSVLLYTTSGFTTTAVLHKKLPYDAERDFIPISRLGESAGYLLLVGANSRFQSVEQLIAEAKKNPGTLSYASGGVGNGTHLVAALLEQAAGVRMIHAPYKTLPIPDLIGGHVDMLFWGASNSRQFVEEGKLRALAITGNKRWSELPNVPALAELGYQSVEVGAWSGLFAPAGVPEATIDAIYRQVAQAYQDKELLELARRAGSTPIVSTPAQFKAFLSAEVERYKSTILPLGIVIE